MSTRLYDMKSCCFTGHRIIKITPELVQRLKYTILNVTRGNHTIVVIYFGDNNYNNATLNNAFYLRKYYITVVAGIMDISNYGNPLIFRLKFQNSITHNYGNPQIFKKKI